MILRFNPRSFFAGRRPDTVNGSGFGGKTFQMSQKKIVLIAIHNGIPLGSWDGSFISREKIEFWSEHDAKVELAHYKSRIGYHYSDDIEVVRGEINFDWDALSIFSRSKNNPLRKRRTATVGQPG